MNGSEIFKTKCPLAWENICDDKSISEEKREEFVSHLDIFVDGDIKEHPKDFFHNDENVFLGTEIFLDTEEVLGRLVEEGAMASHLTDILNITTVKAEELLHFGLKFWIETHSWTLLGKE